MRTCHVCVLMLLHMEMHASKHTADMEMEAEPGLKAQEARWTACHLCVRSSIMHVAASSHISSSSTTGCCH